LLQFALATLCVHFAVFAVPVCFIAKNAKSAQRTAKECRLNLANFTTTLVHLIVTLRAVPSSATVIALRI
jgi:hypothetical protein